MSDEIFAGRCGWVTGASSGLGAALARELAARGMRLVLSGRDMEALAATATDCGDTLILPFEASDYDIADIVAEAWDWSGGIDTVVNNAGVSQRSLAVDTPFSVYEKLVAVDLLAPIALSQANLPRMVARGRGRFVNIASLAGKVGAPLRTGYSAAKHGIIGYGDALRAETAHLGIAVHSVVLGSVRTDVSRNALDGSGKARGRSDAVIEAGLEPAVAARQICDAVAAGTREIVVGSGIELTLGEARRTPDEMFDKVAELAARGFDSQLETDSD